MKENKFEDDRALLSYGIKEWILKKAKAIDYTTIHCFNFDETRKVEDLIIKDILRINKGGILPIKIPGNLNIYDCDHIVNDLRKLIHDYKPKNNANHDIDIKVTQLTEIVLLLFSQYKNLIYTQQKLTKGIVSNLYIFSIVLLSIGCLLYITGVLP